MHHIFRNLWNSRKRNVWILLELIVIAIVCWMVIDPLFVIFYNKSIPDGYEADGLYRLQLSVVPSDEEIRPEDFRKLKRMKHHTVCSAMNIRKQRRKAESWSRKEEMKPWIIQD